MVITEVTTRETSNTSMANKKRTHGLWPTNRVHPKSNMNASNDGGIGGVVR